MSTIKRRDALKGMAATAGATSIGLPLWQDTALAAPAYSGSNGGGPKRVVFFLQNNGFDPGTCIPASMVNSGSLAKATLPEPMAALQPYRERMHIINGLHGRHTSVDHSAFFGALGGYRGANGVPPSAPTIDYELSRALPRTILPHLCIGMDSLDMMKARPTVATLSASGAGQPILMHSNPNHLYKMLFGSVAEGDVRKQHQAQSGLLDRIEAVAAAKRGTVPVNSRHRFGQYVGGVHEINDLRERLGSVSDHLRPFAPEVDERYSDPEFETDWHDVLLDLGIASLKSGITSVLTIGSGRGDVFGAWKGLGIEQEGHPLGHINQPGDPIWTKIRDYNTRMLVKLIEALESVPEGSGTMMDNTLIVYTSNNAEKQHSSGETWPFVLIGSCGGAFKTGCFTQLDGSRPINALYASLLQTVGIPCERFNMSKQMAAKYDSGSGPLKEVLA